MSTPAARRLVPRTLGLILWAALWPLLLSAHLDPIRFAMLRLLMVGGVFALWGGALWLFWRAKPLRVVLLSAALLVALLAVMPGRTPEPRALRRDYVRALLPYEGAPYVWGGESRRGIDCSGLMRCALIDANWQRGLRTFDPALLREAASLWWHDGSAHAMRDGYGGRTRFLFRVPRLNAVDTIRLQPGDIATTAGGAHVLAYIGGATWIEADPSALVGDRVIRVRAPSRNGWFKMPAEIARWRQFEPSQ